MCPKMKTRKFHYNKKSTKSLYFSHEFEKKDRNYRLNIIPVSVNRNLLMCPV